MRPLLSFPGIPTWAALGLSLQPYLQLGWASRPGVSAGVEALWAAATCLQVLRGDHLAWPPAALHQPQGPPSLAHMGHASYLALTVPATKPLILCPTPDLYPLVCCLSLHCLTLPLHHPRLHCGLCLGHRL